MTINRKVILVKPRAGASSTSTQQCREGIQPLEVTAENHLHAYPHPVMF